MSPKAAIGVLVVLAGVGIAAGAALWPRRRPKAGPMAFRPPAFALPSSFRPKLILVPSGEWLNSHN